MKRTGAGNNRKESLMLWSDSTCEMCGRGLAHAWLLDRMLRVFVCEHCLIRLDRYISKTVQHLDCAVANSVLDATIRAGSVDSVAARVGACQSAGWALERVVMAYIAQARAEADAAEAAKKEPPSVA